MISLQQKITISSEVLSQEVDGETVLLDLKSESYFGLDEVGTRIWQLLNDGSDLQTVIDTLLGEYDVEMDRLKTDLDDLLQKLIKAGVVRIETIEEVNSSNDKIR